MGYFYHVYCRPFQCVNLSLYFKKIFLSYRFKCFFYFIILYFILNCNYLYIVFSLSSMFVTFSLISFTFLFKFHFLSSFHLCFLFLLVYFWSCLFSHGWLVFLCTSQTVSSSIRISLHVIPLTRHYISRSVFVE